MIRLEIEISTEIMARTRKKTYNFMNMNIYCFSERDCYLQQSASQITTKLIWDGLLEVKENYGWGRIFY
jgi:hypothetical protein